MASWPRFLLEGVENLAILEHLDKFAAVIMGGAGSRAAHAKNGRLLEHDLVNRSISLLILIVILIVGNNIEILAVVFFEFVLARASTGCSINDLALLGFDDASVHRVVLLQLEGVFLAGGVSDDANILHIFRLKPVALHRMDQCKLQEQALACGRFDNNCRMVSAICSKREPLYAFLTNSKKRRSSAL